MIFHDPKYFPPNSTHPYVLLLTYSFPLSPGEDPSCASATTSTSPLSRPFAKSIGTNEFLFQETEPCVLFHRNVQRNKCSSGNPKTSRSTPASTAAATTPPTVVASTVFASRNRKRTRWYPQHNRGWSHFRSYKCTALRPKNTTDR